MLFPLLEEAHPYSLGLQVSFSERRPLTPIPVTGGLLSTFSSGYLRGCPAQTSQVGGGSVHCPPTAHSSLTE